MKYIVMILLILSLPPMTLVAAVPKNTSEDLKTTSLAQNSHTKTEELSQKIQKKIGYKTCNPKEESRMPTFY